MASFYHGHQTPSNAFDFAASVRVALFGWWVAADASHPGKRQEYLILG
jgi:hypothetical protein